MRCEKCGAKLKKDETRCPSCQKKVKQSTETVEKVSIWKIVAASACCLLLLGVLSYAVFCTVTERPLFGMGGKNATTAPVGTTAPVVTPPTQNTTPVVPGTAEDLGMNIEGVELIDRYAVGDEDALANADAVIARIGDYELTNGMLQVFYWTEFTEFVSEVTSSGQNLVTAFNLDIYKPLYEQTIYANGQPYDVTWEQYLLHNALGTWWQYAVVNMMADEAGYQLSETDKASLAEVPQKLAEEAAKDGYESADALIRDRVGANCSMEDYVAYMELTARGDMYYAYFMENYEPTEEEVREFFELNADYFSYYGITMESGRTATIRHALIEPEGCEYDAYGYIVATDEQWEACRQAGQALLDQWVAGGATEEGFKALANEHSIDPGSNTNGGLYEGVFQGQMVAEFDAWCFDETRKPGDYGLVKTIYGYHLMYFVSFSEREAWYEYGYSGCISSGYGFNNALAAAMQETPLVPSLDQICVSDLKQEPATTETPETTEPVETTGAQ